MHTAILLWGFTAIFGKLIHLNEGLLVWYRMLLSTLAMGVFLAVQKKLQGISPKQVLPIAGIGIVITLHWITFYGAIKASNVSIAISCFSSVALFTALLDPLLRGTKPSMRELASGLAVIAGISIIFAGQQLYLKGIILSVISAFLASLFTILNKRISNTIAPGIITLFEIGTGFIFLTLLLPVWFNITGTTLELPAATDIIYLLLLSVVCTTIAFTLSLHALQKIDAFTMNLSVNLEPVYSIILAFILFNEYQLLNTSFYIGSLIILAAVVLHGVMMIRRAKKEKEGII